MKKIEIEIPEGKEVQWVGDTLKLVDVKKPITERIKTFKDACKELGNHPFVKEYALINPFTNCYSSDLVAYLKLRIIVAALNEGWEPKFTEDEYRYSSYERWQQFLPIRCRHGYPTYGNKSVRIPVHKHRSPSSWQSWDQSCRWSHYHH